MTTLLIVDDNLGMRQLMRSILSKVSDAIFECEDGDEVIAAFATYRPDWVLMDIEMKRCDGLTATAELVHAHPDANVIIVTKHTDEQTRRAAVEAGARDFVSKDNLLSLRTLVKEPHHE
jgi:DNA-binding NarL/FixJ family response regulator